MTYIGSSPGYIRYVCAILFCDNKRTPRFDEITHFTTIAHWDEMRSTELCHIHNEMTYQCG